MVRTSLIGATGRMGKMVRQVAIEDQEIFVSNLCVYYDHPKLDIVQQPEGLPLKPFDVDACINIDVVIDFSLSEAMAFNVEAAAQCACPIVLGATGMQEEQLNILQQYVSQIPIFFSPNTSFGVAVLRNLVQQAAKALPEDYDIEILEMHHRHKLDSPSGTARALGENAALGRGVDHDEAAVFARHDQKAARSSGSIGYAALRGGGIVGDHEVSFTNDFEQIALRHRALDRKVFALGAVRAAKWIVEQPPGLYSMEDMVASLLQ